MRCAPLVLAGVALSLAATRSPDILFRSWLIDGGASETAAVADVNRDGRLDIISGENWYEAPRPGSGQAARPSSGQAPRPSSGQAAWTKHKFRDLNYTSNYYDNFSDLPVDVDRDGFLDVVSVSWFAKSVSWWKNPGRTDSQRLRPERPFGKLRVALSEVEGRGASDTHWNKADINTGFNVEFALLADMDNDGKANEVVAQENGTPQAWYEVKNGAWAKNVVSDRSYGHGIGVGDVNGDGRNDILTPRGWLEAPADPRAANWPYHPDWESLNVPLPADGTPAAPPGAPASPPRVLELGFIHVADVNGDGRSDVVAGAGHNYGVFWFEQRENGQWTRRTIDGAWSQAHASTLVDLNGDGRKDLVTGKRFMAHNGSDPGEKEPLGVYWYEFTSAGKGSPVEWIRHVIDYGGRMGGGMQLPVVDIDGDGDLDIVCPGKSGLFLVENLTKGPAHRANTR